MLTRLGLKVFANDTCPFIFCADNYSLAGAGLNPVARGPAAELGEAVAGRAGKPGEGAGNAGTVEVTT